jgi:anti-sigma factor RsiW
MNKCIESDIQEMLPDLLHGALANDRRMRLEAHLATCESCREELDVLRIVKSAAVFAPSIDVDRVVRQLPPYATILPAVERPARAPRLVTWLVAASLALVVAGGGSVLVTRQRAASVVAGAGSVTSVQPSIAKVASATTNPESVARVQRLTPTAPARTLALAADVDGLSDGSLVQLMTDMDGFDALPAAEPEPVISVDSGDSL